jgi:nucleotide-binding universal stress UspA family protein
VLVANAPPASPYKRVLFSAKLDAASTASIRRFQNSPYLGDADRMLLHVYDSIDKEMLSRAMVPGDERQNRLAQDKLLASEALTRFIDEHGLNIDHPIVRESCGRVAADILAVAAERQADLVTVAPGAKSVFEVAILGRVSLAVLRQAECDVLILPAK